MEQTAAAILDTYFKSWNEGFISKNGGAIRQHMSEQFIGYWAHSNLEIPEVYHYDYDLDSVLASEEGAQKNFTATAVAERKDGSELIITGREQNIIKGQFFYAQCMFIWRKEDSRWKLLREYIELER